MKSEIIFWGILATIALFYILVGNDMYNEKYEMIKLKEQVLIEQRKAKIEELNITK